MRPNPNLYLPIEFQDSDQVVHTAKSWEALAEKVRAYRANAGKPIGEPLKEIFAQVCNRTPNLCCGEQPKKVVPRDPLNKRILMWAVSIFRLREKKELNFQESGHEQARRAEICRRCTQQRAWRSACKGCSQQVDLIFKGMFSSMSNEDLLGCEILGEDTRVSTKLNQPPSGETELPSYCWRKA